MANLPELGVLGWILVILGLIACGPFLPIVLLVAAAIAAGVIMYKILTGTF